MHARTSSAISLRVLGLVLTLASGAYLAVWMILAMARDAFWGGTGLAFSLGLLAAVLLVFVAAGIGIAGGRRLGWRFAGSAGAILGLVGIYALLAYRAWPGGVSLFLGLALLAVTTVGLRRPSSAGGSSAPEGTNRP